MENLMVLSFALCKLRYTFFWWYFYQHVYVIWAHFRLYYRYPFPFAQFS